MKFNEIARAAWTDEQGLPLDLRGCAFDSEAEERELNAGKEEEIISLLADTFSHIEGTKAEKGAAFTESFLKDDAQLQALLENFSLPVYQKKLTDDICALVTEVCSGKVRLREIRAAYKRIFASCAADAEQGQKVLLECMEKPLNCPGWVVSPKRGTVKIITDKEKGTEKRQQLLPVPLAITKRLRNIDNGTLSFEVAAEIPQGEGVRTVKGVLAASALLAKNQVISLTDTLGVGVSSNTAGLAVDYFQTLINSNLAGMQEGRAVDRLGWVDGAGFFPYTAEGLELDAAGRSNRAVYEGFTKTAGEKEKCLAGLAQLRQGLGFRLMMSAALAAPLVALAGINSFAVEVVGETEKGKSQGLFAVASCFGCADEGSSNNIVVSANGTINSFSARLSFAANLPFFLDETQLLDARIQSRLPYFLAQGMGRGRANIYGSARDVARWQTVALLTGEKSLSGGAAQNGAENRLITLDIDETELYNEMDPADAAALIHEKVMPNYGHVGRDFISCLKKEKVLSCWSARRAELRKAGKGKTAKQLAAVALMLAADDIYREIFAGEEERLDAERVAGILCKSKDEISMGVKAWDFIQDFILANKNSFLNGDLIHDEHIRTCYGKITQDAVFMYKTELDKALRDSSLHINFDYIKKDWAKRGWLERNAEGKFTVMFRVGNGLQRAVKLFITGIPGIDFPV